MPTSPTDDRPPSMRSDERNPTAVWVPLLLLLLPLLFRPQRLLHPAPWCLVAAAAVVYLTHPRLPGLRELLAAKEDRRSGVLQGIGARPAQRDRARLRFHTRIMLPRRPGCNRRPWWASACAAQPFQERDEGFGRQDPLLAGAHQEFRLFPDLCRAGVPPLAP